MRDIAYRKLKKKTNMSNFKFCNADNSTRNKSIHWQDIDENNDPLEVVVMKCESFSNNTTDLDEFEQVLKKYREQQGSEYNKHLNTQESNNIEDVIEISIDMSENVKTNNFQGTDVECQRNNDIHNDRKFLKHFDTDVISITSDESVKICASDHSVELDAISLASNNIFTDFEKSNENKSIEIEIDTNLPNNTDFDEIIPVHELYASSSAINYYEKEPTGNILNDTTFDEDDNSNCSYHSSDFEFITEEEAKKDGLIVNFRRKNEENGTNNEQFIEMYLPGARDKISHQETHVIPEGEEFYNLFHAPAMIPDLIFLENKSVIPSQCMSVEREMLRFDLKILSKEMDVVDEKYKNEANETAKRIFESYQGHNKRKHSHRHLNI